MDTVNAIAHEVTDLKASFRSGSNIPACCNIAYQQALSDVLEIIDGYTNREDQEESTRVFTKS